ncbi:glycosyltransferase family 4 protein [Nitrosopumilus ureiphilus]|uniref:Glycosyl transferase family 1 n=1 Tax=Nitrosopumilus ureiphilus TaxID=1470067 RepID=A0A7D5R4U4_9ARCH|nr:glycosyltransferase family 4 protein [Nitrosopumilus ureiphilus]QLH05757.1 glycosyl transferase family 1 [Nitrosopumilus ureiphilus]
MKLLIAYGSQGKFFHLNEFSDALQKLGVKTMLIKDTDFSTGFPSKRPQEWFGTNKKFRKLIDEFTPDAVFIDRQSHFGIDTIKSKIPLFVLLRGHYWSEIEWAKKTLYKGPIMRSVIWFRNKIAEKCFRDATAILPICKYLENIVKEHHPKQETFPFLEGINAEHWYNVEGMKLKHPCVGLLQGADWWGKTKEMLILKKVMDELPNVNFYWVGDGVYREKIISELEKFENFNWLGHLQYPEKVREFLSEIDIYALVSGMDLAPLTLKEAQLMEKPVIATDTGGISEMMQDNETGFLVEEGNANDLIDKISILLNDKKLALQMGKSGRQFVIKTFSWDVIAKRFLDYAKNRLKINLD